MARESYTFDVSPEYTVATYFPPSGDYTTMNEWTGRSLEDFTAGMAKKRGFAHRVEKWTNSMGHTIENHTWERN